MIGRPWLFLGYRSRLGTQRLSPFMISLSGWSWLPLHDFPFWLVLATAPALEPKACLTS